MSPEPALLERAGVKLGLSAVGRDDAVEQTGRLLLDIGAVQPEYVEAMHVRERSVSTYVGEGVAIPHGTNESRRFVQRTAIVVLQFPAGVEWGGGEDVRLCVGIAAAGHEQVRLLSALAHVLMNPRDAARIREASDADTVIRMLQSMEEAEL